MNILIQGAMNEEVDILIQYFQPHETKIINGYAFFLCKHKSNNIIISKTQKGIINASICTTLALTNFNIDIVINQGCAGAHREDLHIGDIVIGKKVVYINDFKSPQKLKGEGSNSLHWQENKKRSYKIEATTDLVERAKIIPYKKNVIVGIIGSGDLHSREYDRIKFLRETFGEDCEDMETIACFKACETFNVKKLAIRIISNNDLISETFDKTQCSTLQYFIIDYIKNLIAQ